MVVHPEVLRQLCLTAGISHDPKAFAEVQEAVSLTAAEDLSPLLQPSSLRRGSGVQNTPVLGVVKFKWFARSRTASCVLSDGKRKVRCCLTRPTRAVHGSLLLVSRWRVSVVNKTMYMDAIKWEALTCRYPAVLGPESPQQQAPAPATAAVRGTLLAATHLAEGGVALHLAVDSGDCSVAQLHVQPSQPSLLAAMAWLHPGVELRATALASNSEHQPLRTTGASVLEVFARKFFPQQSLISVTRPGCVTVRAHVAAVSARGLQLAAAPGDGAHRVPVFWEGRAPRLPWTVRPGSLVTLYHLLPRRLVGGGSPLLQLEWTGESTISVHTCGSEPPCEQQAAEPLEARTGCPSLLCTHNAAAVAADAGCGLQFAASLLNSTAARAALAVQSVVYSSTAVLSFVQRACSVSACGNVALPAALLPQLRSSSAGSGLAVSLPNAAGTHTTNASDAWLAAALRVHEASGELLVGPPAWHCRLHLSNPQSPKYAELLRHCSADSYGVCILIRNPSIHAHCFASQAAGSSSLQEQIEEVRAQAARVFSLQGKAERALFANEAVVNSRVQIADASAAAALCVSCALDDITLLAKLAAPAAAPSAANQPSGPLSALPTLSIRVVEPLRSKAVTNLGNGHGMRHSLFGEALTPGAGLAAGQSVLVHVIPRGVSLLFARAAAPGSTLSIQALHVDAGHSSVLGCVVGFSTVPPDATSARARRKQLHCTVHANHSADLAALRRAFAALCDVGDPPVAADENDLQLYDLRGLLVSIGRGNDDADPAARAVSPNNLRLKLLTAAGASPAVYVKHQVGAVLPPLLPGSIVNITCVRRLVSSTSISVYAATTAASAVRIEAVGQNMHAIVHPDVLPFACCGALLRGGGRGLSQQALRLRASRVRCIWFELDADSGACTSQWIVVDGTGESIVRCTGAVSWLLCGLPPHRQAFWQSVAKGLRHLSPGLSFSSSLMNTDLRQFLLSAQHFLTAQHDAPSADVRRLGHSRLCSAAVLALQRLEVPMCTDVEESVHLLCLEVALAALHGVRVPLSEAGNGSTRDDDAWVWLDSEPAAATSPPWTHEVDLVVRQTFSSCTVGSSAGSDGAAELQWRAGRFLGSADELELEPPQPSRPAQVTIAPRRGGGNVSTSTRAMPRVNLTALAGRPVLPHSSLADSLSYLQKRLQA